MPAEKHHLPTVLGPLNGSGNKSFTVTILSSMAIELGCVGSGKDMASVTSPIGAFSIPCGSQANEPFGGTYATAADNKQNKFPLGQRVQVRITAALGDNWQLWITGGSGSIHTAIPGT